MWRILQSGAGQAIMQQILSQLDVSGRRARYKRFKMPLPQDLRTSLLKRQYRQDAYIHDYNEEQEDDDEVGELPNVRAQQCHVPPARAPGAYAPLSCDDCFSSALEIDISCTVSSCRDSEKHATIRAYFTPPCSGLTPSSTVMVCHHGAGFGALSFALMAKEVSRISKGELGVLAYDCRGHGKTTFPLEEKKNMSLEALTSDLLALLRTMFRDVNQRPSFLFVGHSMGGAVVVEAAHALEREHDIRVAGVAMIDIVEDTSLQLLPDMSRIVRQRPLGFASLESAIQWHIKTRTIRNAESARRSVPSLVHLMRGYRDLPWRWNADLIETEPYWTGWFKGLSSKFLACHAARLLILAETDRLDRTLMIGQMQGKYQLVVNPHAGHCVQEDDPTSTADTLFHFWRRNDKLPPGLRPVGRS